MKVPKVDTPTRLRKNAIISAPSGISSSTRSAACVATGSR